MLTLLQKTTRLFEVDFDGKASPLRPEMQLPLMEVDGRGWWMLRLGNGEAQMRCTPLHSTTVSQPLLPARSGRVSSSEQHGMQDRNLSLRHDFFVGLCK